MANEFDYFDLHCLGRDKLWTVNGVPGKDPLERLRWVFTASDGYFQVKTCRKIPKRDGKTFRALSRGSFLRLGLSATSLTIHCVLMYYVDAAVRPAVPELFGNKY